MVTRVAGAMTFRGRVGIWVSGTKLRDMDMEEFAEICREKKIEVIKINQTRPLSEQGSFQVLIHRLTEEMHNASTGDTRARRIIDDFQEYITSRPGMLVMDPLDSIKTLLDRGVTYSLIRRLQQGGTDDGICIPNFVELKTSDPGEICNLMAQHGVTFPFVCKTKVAEANNSNEMMVIFGRRGLREVRPPCVAQSFINHNAVLHKVYVVGTRWVHSLRLSIKNFPQGEHDADTVFFHSHEVCKPNKNSPLSVLDDEEPPMPMPLCERWVHKVVHALQDALHVTLVGVDVIVENGTGRHYVIDVNALPSYDCVPEFSEWLADYLNSVMK
ncbi:inositol-tetrakisphosphate 1-kinase-like isoform X2 [Petromyzon marinus]|uniref:Inositol-tetrakisphosphate 1-kinase n=1 Tax=Petromyzon marinus TaxID=7757 RepID=A0AAJ7TPI9_PETMA|nr:inositol-tetrakisphosphate 1-kinase-like isoform X2 [Petromyzon marinus]